MRTALIAMLSTVALAACGSPDPDTDGDGKISMEEAAARSDELIKPQPGKYRSTTELISIEMPKAPPELRAMMEKSMASRGPETIEYCLTPEEAEKGFAEAIRETRSNDDCSFERFDADDGDIDAVMVCRDPSGSSARMTLQGTGQKTSSAMTMTMEMEGADVAMTMKMKMEQERIGDCDA